MHTVGSVVEGMTGLCRQAVSIFGFRLFHMHSPYLRLFIERIGTALRLAYDCWVSEQPDSGRDVGVRGAGAAPPRASYGWHPTILEPPATSTPKFANPQWSSPSITSAVPSPSA